MSPVPACPYSRSRPLIGVSGLSVWLYGLFDIDGSLQRGRARTLLTLTSCCQNGNFISSRFASGIPICPHADTNTVTPRSLDAVTGTVQHVEECWGRCVGSEWCRGRGGSGHESSKVKYPLEESWGSTVVILFIFRHTSPKLRKFSNAVCYCRWFILWSFVKMLKIPLFDNSSFELQTGSLIPVPFVSNSRRKKKPKTTKKWCGKSFSSWVRLWVCELLLQFTGCTDSTFHRWFHRRETEVITKHILVSHLLSQQGQTPLPSFPGRWVSTGL